MKYALLAALGLLELLAPRQLVAWGSRLAYDSPEELTPRGWTYPAVRLEGLVFLSIALRGMRRKRAAKRAARPT